MFHKHQTKRIKGTVLHQFIVPPFIYVSVYFTPFQIRAIDGEWSDEFSRGKIVKELCLYDQKQTKFEISAGKKFDEQFDGYEGGVSRFIAAKNSSLENVEIENIIYYGLWKCWITVQLVFFVNR